MQIKEIIKTIEKFAPPHIAWDKDNIGLQVGNSENKITNIFLTLDLTFEALNQALQKKCNLIITHHPLIFSPLRKLNFESDNKSQLIEKLIKNNITVFSAHTNLDFTKDGVSFELAKKLGLEKTDFLEHGTSRKYKLVTFVPADSMEMVRAKLFACGAGNIGEYSNCAFSLTGQGSFLGSAKSNPKIGKKEKFETVEEIRLEVVVDEWNLTEAVKELLKIHPYETPAYDIYKLENKNEFAGFGTIGFLKHKMSTNEFLLHTAKSLGIKNFRYTITNKKFINKVAVCGGSGIELLPEALKQNADAFITADVKYHSFQDAEEKILLIDAGHFETEIFGLNSLKKIIENKIAGTNIRLIINKKSTSPIKFFNKKEI